MLTCFALSGTDAALLPPGKVGEEGKKRTEQAEIPTNFLSLFAVRCAVLTWICRWQAREARREQEEEMERLQREVEAATEREREAKRTAEVHCLRTQCAMSGTESVVRAGTEVLYGAARR